MQRRESWKVVTLGFALTGLGIAGAGIAQADGTADTAAHEPPGISVEAPATADTALLAMDDSWDDSHDDSWDDTY